jgi:1-acyl-sn-glycerol-3-phosphate acyltransferase
METWRSYLWYEFNYWMVWTGYTLAFSFRSEGSRHVPRKGPFLIVANHESFLDPLAIGLAVRRHIHFLARKTLFRPPWFGKYLHSVNCVPVDQEGIAKEGLRTCIDLLRADMPVLVFPEGERTADGKMLTFKPGVALLMKWIPVPVVPVGVAGAYEAFPRQAPFPRLSPLCYPPTGAAVAACVGKPIPPEHFAQMSREQMLEEMFQAVAAQVKHAEKIVRKPKW